MKARRLSWEALRGLPLPERAIEGLLRVEGMARRGESAETIADFCEFIRDLSRDLARPGACRYCGRALADEHPPSCRSVPIPPAPEPQADGAGPEPRPEVFRQQVNTLREIGASEKLIGIAEQAAQQAESGLVAQLDEIIRAAGPLAGTRVIHARATGEVVRMVRKDIRIVVDRAPAFLLARQLEILRRFLFAEVSGHVLVAAEDALNRAQRREARESGEGDDHDLGDPGA